jgi:hypothetical protein
VVGESDDKPQHRRKPVDHDEDAFPMVPKYRQRTWAGLRWSEQTAVLRAARRRETHPDPAIAKAARDWAREVLTPRPPREGREMFSCASWRTPSAERWGSCSGSAAPLAEYLLSDPSSRRSRPQTDCP